MAAAGRSARGWRGGAAGTGIRGGCPGRGWGWVLAPLIAKSLPGDPQPPAGPPAGRGMAWAGRGLPGVSGLAAVPATLLAPRRPTCWTGRPGGPREGRPNWRLQHPRRGSRGIRSIFTFRRRAAPSSPHAPWGPAGRQCRPSAPHQIDDDIHHVKTVRSVTWLPPARHGTGADREQMALHSSRPFSPCPRRGQPTYPQRGDGWVAEAKSSVCVQQQQ